MQYSLRELNRNDLATITKWRNDRQIIENLGTPFRYIGSEVDIKWFDNYLATRANNVRLAICAGDKEEIIGAVYLLAIDWLNRSGELALWIGKKSAQGKGAGEFACREILKHAFLEINLNRVFLTVLNENIKATNLYRKIGFKEEGRLRQAVYKNGKYEDLLQMGILACEYLDQSNSDRHSPSRS